MNRRGVTKKPAVMCSDTFRRDFDTISKAALIDALWCASQLGTDETREQIHSQASRSVEAALRERGDRIPKEIEESAKRQIDSDPPEVAR